MMPVYNMLAGGIVKIATNYFLIATDTINIGGAPISTLCCYMTIAILNLLAIKRVINPRFSLVDNIIKPVFAAAVMGVSAFAGYNLAAKIIGAPEFDLAFTLNFIESTNPITPVAGSLRIKTAIALVVAIGIAVVVYMVLIFLLKAIKKEDILMMPKGEKLAKLLIKCKLIH